MSTQQDIYAAGSESRPPMLNKENYVPWSSCLLCYAKSRANGKLIHNSIINGPYVRRMILELGDTNWEVPMNETFHIQIDDELTEKELKQIEADDQAIQTILFGSDIGIQEKKAKLFNEWERFASNKRESIEFYYHPFLKLMNDLKRNKHFRKKIATHHQDQPSFNQNYMQQPMPNPKDITNPTTAINMALALMAKAFKLNYLTSTNNNQRISSNPRNRQIAQPGMNMGQDRQMQMVGGNGENHFRQYAGQNIGNLNGYNAIQNVRNQVAQNPRVQNVRNQIGLIGVPGNINQTRNGNLEAARAEGNAVGHNDNQIRCYNCRGKEEAVIQLQAKEFDLMAVAADLDKIKEVNPNCILMANLQQASTSGTQTEKALVYDSDGSAEVHGYKNCYDNEIFNMFAQEEQYTKLLEPIPEQHQVPQNDNNVVSKVTSVEQSGETVEQHPANFEETRVIYDSLYQNLAYEVEKVNSVNQFSNDTTPSVARKFLNEVKSTIVTLQRVVKHRMNLETHNWSSSAHQELHKIIKDENFPIVNQVDVRVQNFEIQFLKEAAKFVGDFKSLAKEANESLTKQKALELEIERVLRAFMSQDIISVVQKTSVGDTSNLQTELERTKERFENCIIKKENEYAKLWNDWYKKCDACKYDKISYDKAYKDMQQKIERLQAQLGDLKGKSKDTSCVSDTFNLVSQKLENENVELEFQDNKRGTSANTTFVKQSIKENLPKVGETHALSKPVTSNSVPTPQESKVMKNDKVIAPGMFRINPFKTSREEKHVSNNVRASARTKPITVSQHSVITKKDVNSDSNGLSSTGIDNTKTRRP
nr:hypothetical protein [Tanacetum cinerariifolium]